MGAFETDLKCIQQREYVNIPLWDKYTGEGLTIFHDDFKGDHSECCADIIKTILPDARVLQGTIGFITSHNIVTSCVVSCDETNDNFIPFEEFIIEHNISLINNSTDGGDNDSNSAISIYMQGMINKYNLIITGAAGNFGMTNKYQGAGIMVGGVSLVNGQIKKMTSDGEPIDFVMFMGNQIGSSFAAPFLNGMIGLLRSKYPSITQKQAYAYMKHQSKDLGDVGDDIKYGWGLPIMKENTKVLMQIGNKIINVDGMDIEIEQPPMIDRVTDRTLVPVRAMSEAFSIDVKWDNDTRTITLED